MRFVLANPAYLPSSPESPNRLGILLLGGLFGLAAGGAVGARFADRWRSLFTIFAVIELLLGLFGLGSILSMYLALPNGPSIIATAFGGTALIFLGLSGYALTSKRDFSFMGGFLFAGMMVVVLAMVANLFLQIPALALAVSAGIILLMSGFILFDTSRIVRGGETNYIMATYGLYLSIFNIFISLLNILGIMGGDENAITLITAEGEESWPRMGKDAVAQRLAERIAEALG